MAGEAADPTLDSETAQRALLDEGLKKGALLWLELGTAPADGQDPRPHPRWYSWTDSRVYLVTGGEEQPDPGLADASRVRGVVRSKANGHRLLAFDADVSIMSPSDDDWETATAALAKDRLNLARAEEADRRWSEPPYAVYRLTPILPLVDEPAEERTSSRRAAPAPTSATTAGRKPWVLHRRGRSGRPLS